MKKIVFVILSSAYLLSACHSGTQDKQQGITNGPANTVDTTKMHANQQAADTSVKDGIQFVRYPNGVIKEKNYYVAGRRQGECQSFYPSGKMMSDCYFMAGLSDGSCIAYYENGQKRYEGNFAKGKPSGKWSFYNETGKLTRTTNYGKKTGDENM
jgi:antitoxin component YwqK of YwqJK toxin-antitoxin module